jgi:hypothetical protein
MTSVPRRFPEINTYAAAYHPNRTYYVSPDGVNQTNAGSFMRPYKTLQYAHDSIVVADGNEQQVLINVAPGVYTETLTITKSNLFWKGDVGATRASGLVSLYGNIVINVTTGPSDAVNRVVGFQGFKIQESDASIAAISVQSTQLARHLFYDVYCFSSGTSFFTNVSSNPLFIYNSIFQIGSGSSSSDCIIASGSGGIIMTDCEVYSVSTGHLINVSGSARLSLNRCILENSCATTPASLIKYTSSYPTSVVALTTITTSKQAAAVELSAGKALTLANNIISVGGAGGTVRFTSPSASGTILTNLQNSSVAGTAVGNLNVNVVSSGFVAF